MGKRSDFVRLPQDKYDTPAEAVLPLLPHLKPCARFIEPCCGAGYLFGHLKHAGHVLVGTYDLPIDARTTRYAEVGDRRGLRCQPAVGPRRSCTKSSPISPTRHRHGY